MPEEGRGLHSNGLSEDTLSVPRNGGNNGTKLERIAEISATTPKPEFTSLYHLINTEMLTQCHKELDGKNSLRRWFSPLGKPFFMPLDRDLLLPFSRGAILALPILFFTDTLLTSVVFCIILETVL